MSKKVLFLSATLPSGSAMTLRWEKFYAYKKTTFYSKNVSWNLYTNNKSVKLLLVLKTYFFIRFKRIQFVHVNDLESGMLAKYLRQWFGVKYIFSANEIFSHEVPEENEGEYVRAVKLAVEKEVLLSTSIVLVPNEQRIAFFKKIHVEVEFNRYVLMENKSLDFMNVQVDKSLSKKIENDFSVFYGGTFWQARRQETFPALASKLHKETAVLVLSGKMNEYFKGILNSSEHIRYVGNIPTEQFNDFVRHVDICLAWYFPTTINDELCAPLKIFDYLLAGKPVLAPDLPYIKELANRFPDCISLFQAGNMDDCYLKIQVMRTNYENYVQAVKRLNPLTVLWDAQFEMLDSKLKEKGL